MTTTLNHSLASLPSIGGTPLNRPKNHAELVVLINARIDAANEVRSNILDLASTMLDRGDLKSARELIAESALYGAEVDALVARRVA